MNWMAWTLPTAVFFGVIAAALVAMTLWESLTPCSERRGFLPIATTRGDRLFIGLLTSAFIHLLFLGLTEVSLWVVLALSVVWLAVVMRWG